MTETCLLERHIYSLSILNRQLSQCLFLMDYFSLSLSLTHSVSLFLSFFPPPSMKKSAEFTVCCRCFIVLCCVRSLAARGSWGQWSGVQGSVPSLLFDWRGMFLPEYTCPLPEWSTCPEPASHPIIHLTHSFPVTACLLL